MPRSTKRVTARPALDTRKQIRTTSDEWDTWTTHAQSLGFVGAAPWIRRVANEAIEKARLAAAAAEVARKEGTAS